MRKRKQRDPNPSEVQIKKKRKKIKLEKNIRVKGWNFGQKLNERTDLGGGVVDERCGW